MKIKCIKSGGFMGQEFSCEIDMDELNTAEKEAFQVIEKEGKEDPQIRDSFVYHFKVLQNDKEDNIRVDETLLTEKMIPFINKVDSKLE